MTEPCHSPPDWTAAAPLPALQAKGAMTVKLRGRQIALFLQDGQVHACNNRCPHEGYPLVEGDLGPDCVLTCHWHNWKFDLRQGGANLYGGDRLRVYPARVQDGQVQIDLQEPGPAERIAQALAQLDAAMADNDRPRIARELARAEKAGATAEAVLLHAIACSHDRFRYGMTHAHAAAEAWLRLRDGQTDPAARLACLAEALGYLSIECLREPACPYTEAVLAWDADAFLAAVEAQDEATALALLQGALGAGRGVEDLLPTLTRAALAHYNDFGHSLIYLQHLRLLLPRLGAGAARPLLRLWLRALIYATREDLLPDFRAYAPALAAWPEAAAAGARHAPPAVQALQGRSVKQTLAALLAIAAAPVADLLPVLAQAAAHQLLRFDVRVATRADNAVADNVGWLDFSHGLTFAQALHALLPADSPLWPAGLLQLGLFVGRNTPYLDARLHLDDELARWSGSAALATPWQQQVMDHGLGLDIFAVHWLKTSLAVDALASVGWPDGVVASLVAARGRLLAASFKQRHPLRNAHQALAFVARED